MYRPNQVPNLEQLFYIWTSFMQSGQQFVFREHHFQEFNQAYSVSLASGTFESITIREYMIQLFPPLVDPGSRRALNTLTSELSKLESKLGQITSSPEHEIQAAIQALKHRHKELTDELTYHQNTRILPYARYVELQREISTALHRSFRGMTISGSERDRLRMTWDMNNCFQEVRDILLQSLNQLNYMRAEHRRLVNLHAFLGAFMWYHESHVGNDFPYYQQLLSAMENRMTEIHQTVGWVPDAV